MVSDGLSKSKLIDNDRQKDRQVTETFIGAQLRVNSVTYFN